MSIFKRLSLFEKSVLLISLLLIIYGYACRLFGLYFFWESRFIGWTVLLLEFVIYLAKLIKAKSLNRTRKVFSIIGICLVSFFLLLQIIFYIVIPQTGAFAMATEYLANDIELKKEIGKIDSFVLIPAGNISVSSGEKGEEGTAEFGLIVKGQKKYRDIYLSSAKSLDTKWRVIAVGK